MAEAELQPLDPSSWFESLGRLRSTARGPRSKIENRLRQSFYLTNLAPPPFSALAECVLEEAEFEALLKHAAFESAAIALLGRVLSFEIASTWPGPEVSARVWVEDICGEARVASDCVASVLVQAWLELLLQFRKRTPELPFPAPPKARRRSRSGPPRTPILH